MRFNGKHFLNINVKPTVFQQLQCELFNLFHQVIKGDVFADKLDEVGFLVSISGICGSKFPALHSVTRTRALLEIMNNQVIRFLYSDPTQYDPDTPTNVLDRYFPHIDKNGKTNIPAGSINFPIINCNEQTTTYWHDLKKDELDRVVKFDWVEILYEESERTIVEELRMSMNKSYLIRTDRFHSLKNCSASKRVIGAWHTKPGFSWEDIIFHLSKNGLVTIK